MAAKEISGTDWTPNEVNLVVADYFEMLTDELEGRPFVKAQRNSALQALTGRKRGSIEFKHQNISAVLVKLGLPWIVGYKPLFNFQAALIDGVERFMAGWDQTTLLTLPAVRPALVAEPEGLWIGPPPVADPEQDRAAPEALRRLVRKFDPAERDARNRALGERGEALVLAYERQQLAALGRDDLAKRVRWTAQEDGDGAGYDIRSFAPDGSERLVEVKTTVGHALTPFFLSENERAFSEQRRDAFRLVRVYDFAREPRGFELTPPLVDWVRLRATGWRAEVR